MQEFAERESNILKILKKKGDVFATKEEKGDDDDDSSRSSGGSEVEEEAAPRRLAEVISGGPAENGLPNVF